MSNRRDYKNKIVHVIFTISIKILILNAYKKKNDYITFNFFFIFFFNYNLWWNSCKMYLWSAETILSNKIFRQN